jgi:DNA polymerase I-like protein with 3'-5' exonuclease and polymerase domains
LQLGLPQPVEGASEYIIALRDEASNPYFPDETEVGQILSRILLKPGVTIIGSFIFTDSVWLKDIGLDLKPKFIETIESQGRTGIFDVAMAAKATDEYLELDLCKLASVFLGAMAWDGEIAEWVSQQDTSMFGHAPARILFPYAAKDVKYSLLLEQAIRKPLERDKFGNNCYPAYLNNMRMCAALCEMMRYGLKVDRNRLEDMRQKFTIARERLLAEVRADLNWPDFDPGKTQHLIAALFNEGYLQKKVAPEGAKSLHLSPIKPTNKRYRSWDAIPASERPFATPCVDKEVCGILAEKHPVAAKIRDLGIFKHVLTNIFGTRGLETHICDDGRVRSFIAPTTESGRCSSSRPNVQNFSNKRDADYSRLCGADIKMRSFLVAEPGYDFVECDFVAAELMLLAVMANDPTLLEHCLRSALPDDDPDYFDIHSYIAVNTFGFDCEPTKKGLASIGKSHFRVVSKSVIYGLNYGRGAPAIREALKAEGIHIELHEVEAIMDRIFQTYSRVPSLLDQLRKVVYDPGFQVNYFGRCRRFIRSNDQRRMQDQERESLNFPFQSMTADCLDILTYKLYTHPEKERLGYRILAPVHDALWIECPKEHTGNLIDLIHETAETVTFRQWDTRGRAVGDKEFALSMSVSVKGEKDA